ncbi:RNA-binding protein, putative [Talaromyces stipitatus ATCC 10500]|uniref:RNA-binding protein, putative n=1 Tax=Talaromyces stipitatus (strain ATCC 10500 / CBS 375.48 / QM 6759 / NRRL 1006) TaxID=441959 RepID=B8MJE0_TALSN|nr:RNA-binding protein, putative [Talaromyces stipitatus ATCC 10500]EED15139.1 RNA-binding protein, putative [Talaromyces stipitatus ATCC 10500]
MAFKSGFSERLDELRFPSPRSPPVDAPFSHTPLSPPASMMSAFSRPTTDVRANLQRRFTTDASKLSSWSFLNQQPITSAESLDLLSSIEKKRQHIEYMREQRKRFEADMKLLDLQHERERQEIDQLARDLAQAGLTGPVSEPTTPPEYRDSGFPSAFARPTRFSTSSVTSSPGIFNIFSPSQVTSPPPAPQTRNGATATSNNHRFSVHSVPGSRRNSEEEEYFPDSVATYRQGPSIHRYSMPTTSLAAQLKSVTASYNSPAMEPFNAARLLFGDEKNDPKDEDRLPTPDIKSYLKMTDPDDKFPTLSHNSGILSANSDALDLANSRAPEPWSSHHSRYRSMPQGDLNMFRPENQFGKQLGSDSASTSRHVARHSVELNMYLGKQEPTTPTAGSSARPGSLQSSYSTNDLPTVKGNGFTSTAITPPRNHAEQFHQHNASLGRIPAGVANPRSAKQSPEREDSTLVSNGGPQSGLQATATPFGPQLASVASPSLAGQNGSSGLANFQQAQFYPYTVQPYANNGVGVNGGANQNFTGQVPYSGFSQNGMYQLPRASARPNNAALNRGGESEAQQISRFNNLPLEQYKGELYGLCKDQHGCRYLQRKLEERNPEHVQMIFAETHMHVVELMTDPFGNYLCQKLLEYSNDDQRTRLIHNAAPQLVPIALNQHGTRALQKMIEFVSTPQQIQMVIDALRGHVVDLVQDLNGNHVIQKCLNRLSAEDAQFIYDAVGAHCVIVGTHRHGCCVLQRCIDHASGEQRARLIAQITSNAFSLVQDPFGNYVVQYILDLSEPHFTEPLCQSFLGNIPPLSKQKFSSNVIEKCLRTAEYPMRRRMIDEILVPRELDAMLRDSYANYVVQTAMDFADADNRNRIIEAVRPILPSIRQTPHGRRIAGKIAGAESSGRTSGNPSGQATPNDLTSGQLPVSMQVPPKPFMQSPQGGSFNGNGSATQPFNSQQPLVSSANNFNVGPATAGPSEVSNFAHTSNQALPQSQAYGNVGNGFY